MSVRILTGDCRQVLATLPDESVHCVVTSPPYYWQRDYGHPDQIGHEQTIGGFVRAMVETFAQVKRVLRRDGVLFLNLGDTYYSAKGKPHGRDLKSAGRQMARQVLRAVDGPGLGLPRKSLIGIPWRTALALQDDGWTLRSDIIWHRPGSLGEPTAKDRPARAHEHIFMFSRSPRYAYGDVPTTDVWSFQARPNNPDRHAAPFPDELVERCLEIGCPVGGTVLDPFGGSGTTARVADRLGRDALLIELNPTYATMARDRLARDGRAFAPAAAE